MACLAVLREGESLVVPHALEAANAALAATIVQKALLQRVLMTVKRAFAPVNRPKSDRHVRVPLATAPPTAETVSDASVYDGRPLSRCRLAVARGDRAFAISGREPPIPVA